MFAVDYWLQGTDDTINKRTMAHQRSVASGGEVLRSRYQYLVVVVSVAWPGMGCQENSVNIGTARDRGARKSVILYY